VPELPREPPEDVKRQLRREIGFGCPIPGCRNPYLEYHHFDPEWHAEEHHRPAGLIPLCAEHHGKARAWTREQLREFKANAREGAGRLVGRFEWMRRDVITLVGGQFWFGSLRVLAIADELVIWFERSDDGLLLLNLRQPTTSGEPRFEMRNNDWVLDGRPSDVVSPTNGSRIRVRYNNGDDLGVLFWEAASLDSLTRRYKHQRPESFADIPFPLLVVEVRLVVADAGIRLTRDVAQVGAAKMLGHGVIRSANGFVIT
jgi:hypothetical protein